MSTLKDFKELIKALFEREPLPIAYRQELPKTLGTDIKEGRPKE